MRYNFFVNVKKWCKYMPIKLPKETEEKLIKSIKRYFLEYMDDEIGDLKAKLLLDFCVKEIGPSIYNHAVLDAHAYLQDKLADMESSCYKPEFRYWKK